MSWPGIAALGLTCQSKPGISDRGGLKKTKTTKQGQRFLLATSPLVFVTGHTGFFYWPPLRFLYEGGHLNENSRRGA